MGPDGNSRPRRFGAALITARLQRILRWSRKNSLWIYPFGPACCGGETLLDVAERSDLNRTGAEIARHSPRQADLLVVAGRVTLKMLPELLETYREMPGPKWVLSLGDCASGGGRFDTYAHVGGVNSLLPVDVHIPGCPPDPETLLEGLRRMQQVISSST